MTNIPTELIKNYIVQKPMITNFQTTQQKKPTLVIWNRCLYNNKQNNLSSH